MTQIELLEAKLDLLTQKIDLLLTGQNLQVEKDYLFFDWLDEWYSIYKLPKLKKGSLKSMQSVIKCHIKTKDINLALNKLNVVDIDKALSQIASDKSRKTAYIIICDCLRQAYKCGILKNNIAEFIQKVKYTPKEGQALTENVIQKVISNCSKKIFKDLFLFYLYSGCRKMEALNIKWSDIDYKRGVLHIPGTKRASSNRYIPLFPQIKQIIDQQSKRNTYVFAISEASVKREVQRIKNKCRVKFCVKDFRTTFATQLHKIGIDDKVIQKLMGHTEVQTTQKYYIKFDKQLLDSALENYKKLDYENIKPLD